MSSSVESLRAVIEGVRFTPAQKKIVGLLLDGWVIKVVNSHRMNGGEMMWIKPYSEHLQDAGHVYKAFFNIFYQIKKQKGIVFDQGPFIS